MKYLIAAVVLVITALLAFVSLDRSIADKLKVFATADKDKTYISKTLSQKMIIILSAVVAVISFVAAVKIMDKVSDPLGIIKMMLALVCIAGAACFDFRERRIPNIFPLVMAVGAVILLVLGLILKQNGAVAYITTSVVAAVGCAVILFLAALLTKQGIGAGDIKLISALALLTGVHSVIGTLFFGVVACSIFAVIALLMKKKKMSSGVPFGPFLLLGYIITLFAITF